MHRFYLPKVGRGGYLPLSMADSRKISRVLRLAPGSEIQIWDAEGNQYQALITQVTGQLVYVQVIRRLPAALTEATLRLNLVQGIPKGDKMELIIQKATELGVARIIPVESRRTVVRLPEKRRQARRERWQTIAREAARQSGRVRIPEIAPITGLDHLLKGVGEGIRLILWEGECPNLKKLLRRRQPEEETEVYLLVGPEGGLSAEEVGNGRSGGWLPVSLGPRILRTETAGMVALSLILYEWGDLGGD